MCLSSNNSLPLTFLDGHVPSPDKRMSQKPQIRKLDILICEKLKGESYVKSYVVQCRDAQTNEFAWHRKNTLLNLSIHTN